MSELRVDLGIIRDNTRAVSLLLEKHGLKLVAVTKGCWGEPRVAEAMLAGGAIALADACDESLVRLRTALPAVELHRIYLPPLQSGFVPGDITYVSSLEGALAVAALGGDTGCRAGRRRIMVLLESGDLREGVPRDELFELVIPIVEDPRLELEGVATNYACFEGAPDGWRQSVELIAQTARELQSTGLLLKRVSGGNSSLLGLLARGESLPGEITELRCGEALLLGQDALEHRELPGCRGPACVLLAEVLEGYTKFSKAGRRYRAVLGIGRRDLGAGAVGLLEPEFSEVGRSSDYLVVESVAGGARLSVGTMVEMIPSYEALAAAWEAACVELKLLDG